MVSENFKAKKLAKQKQNKQYQGKSFISQGNLKVRNYRSERTTCRWPIDFSQSVNGEVMRMKFLEVGNVTVSVPQSQSLQISLPAVTDLVSGNDIYGIVITL